MLKNIVNIFPKRGISEQQEPINNTLEIQKPITLEKLNLSTEVKMLRPRLQFIKMLTPFNMFVGFIVAGTIFIGACIYYDRLRHRDPDFPKKLKEHRKKQATKHHHMRRIASAHNIRPSRIQTKEVPTIHSKRLTVTIPSQKYEDILINEICIAETYMKQDNTEQALIHFATAIAMSYDPSKIINSLKKTLPPLMYNDLAFILNERYENKFSFMYDDRQILSKIHIPAPQHSMLYH